MGESRRNPRSEQFAGDIPEVLPGADLAWVVEPNAAFKIKIKELREAGVEGPVKITEFERDVVLYARAIWGVPLQTVREVQTSVVAIELHRWPLVEFKKMHKANFERLGMAHAAATIVIPTEEPAIIA